MIQTKLAVLFFFFFCDCMDLIAWRAGCACMQANSTATIEYLMRVTKAVAEAPYKATPSALAAVVKVRVPHAPSSSTLRPLATTWNAMLQMVPGISAKKAAAITARYPTLRSLLAVYRDACLSEADKARVLEDAEYAATKKRMTKLSADVYTFLTRRDAAAVIGSTRSAT